MNAGANFGINGRFLTQPVTGVQRYARNVVEAMDRSLATARASAELLVPAGTADPHYAAISRRELGPLNGHAWEQLTLAMRWPDRLLSLCNTGPVAKADQIVCIHDANVFTAPESYGRAFRTFYGLLQPQLARRAARVATVSNASARQIARYLSLDSADIAVLPNGHEHALAWDPSLAELAPSVIEDGSHPRRFVLAIGSRARHKNMQLLVDIAPDLAAMGIDVVIAGGDAGIFAPETLKSAPNVTVIGRISDHDLAYLMDRALCLAFPSWTEGFGLPIVEAMARGCAVISSDRASMPEICGDAALMASPAEPAAWIRQVRTLAESAQLRDDMVGRGRERVRLFSWDTTANGYISLMQDPRRSMARRAEPASPLAEPRIAAVVATLGRPEVVSRTVRHLLATQALKPSTVIVSCADVSDAGDLADLAGVTILTGPTGLPRQRNTALDALPADTDIVAFFDDDFVADADWLAAAARTFHDEPTVVGFTGHVLADGIKGPGIAFDEAARIVATADPKSDWTWIEPYSPYGCNMAFRASSIGDLRFDGRLVLYGWLEDRDFAAALARKGGRLVKCADARGVHMGVKGGRVRGERLGYSQVANPVYMLRKGTMSIPQVADHIFRNLASNVAKAPWPEPFIDRRGRLRGNVLALADVLRGRIEPERAARLQPKTGT
ncbi:glycosyltransferase family 4 protein [Phreatobacter aquaticus]|uniref:Glycosyltransferase family 4 protein n=1 Tax=Phreatobacter aquaticus TaxID=2570229 RepID=A0A4D7QQN5_9HYPH|nr:glycosyltransferase family 1 protein [Phreatobacter aquaticus]QCK87819.1 glycosyltransferase family 4 protein [Phreatobacter aquaticus]